ncbi:MAG: LysR family transcriptional regulator [Pseudomonadota bacterium]
MTRKIPMLQALNCFDAAARHESYTHAARELSLTQGAVSRQIASLENFLGLRLFQRTRHGVALTPAGADYAKQVALRLAGLERDTLDAMARQGSGGAVRLASVPTFGSRWLMPRLPDLHARHADIVVHIDARTRPFMFTETEYDAALYSGSAEQIANWPGTRAVMLMPEAVVPVASPSLLAGRKRWQPEDIASLPLLQQSTRPDAWREWFEAMNVSTELAMHGPRYELFSMLAIAATHSMGVALLPTMLVESELRSGVLQIACDKALRGKRSYYLVTPETEHEKPALTLFREWLLEQAQQVPALG